MRWPVFRRWYVLSAIVAALAVVLAVASWAPWQNDGTGDRAGTAPRTTPAATPAPAPAEVAPLVGLTPKPSCSSRVIRPFVPVRMAADGITSRGEVVALPRDGEGVPGVPPLSGAGKMQFAWDAPGIKPGTTRGNVLVNAHIWPDGSAMGDRLLRDLHEGDVVVLTGAVGERLCYRITDRVEVSVENPPVDRVYDSQGPPQLVVITCSGRRLGPGDWTHRTLWFARPIR